MEKEYDFSNGERGKFYHPEARLILPKQRYQPLANQRNKQLEALKNALVDKFDAKQIFLFGSHAYGRANADSDLDLCVITNLGKKKKIDVMRDIRRELIDLVSSPIDILVYSEKEFRERANLKSTLEYKIRTDGMKLYG